MFFVVLVERDEELDGEGALNGDYLEWMMNAGLDCSPDPTILLVK